MRLGVVLAASLWFGCSSFGDPCREDRECSAGFVCEQGECLQLDPESIHQCRPSTSETERCNGRDDDCDDRVDEGCNVGDDCTIGAGICERPGALIETDAGVVCEAEPGAPEAEICDALDNDCDGLSDEDCAEGDRCSVGLGVCRRYDVIVIERGLRRCGAEPGLPGEELCGDSGDEDCDGRINEGFDELGAPCEAGLGECLRQGEMVCDGTGLLCNAMPGMPETERCDRRDEDCDGRIDEDFGVGEPCADGVGACRSMSTTICNGTGDGALCPAVPGLPSAETCNGIDDDCDEFVDEGDAGASLERICGSTLGVCQEGIEACANGRWSGECAGGITPVDELCDGLDNDCDGTVDGLNRPCGNDVGACEFGLETCLAAQWGECIGGRSPQAENCNGADDDCDGQIDEGEDGIEGSVSRPCGAAAVGECRLGIESCGPGGSWSGQCIGEVPPSAEQCNALDDDCDGATDEAFAELGGPCVSGAGVCAQPGRYQCSENGNRLACDAVPMPPRDETCNGFDDDCDQQIDEIFHIGRPCLDQGEMPGRCRCGANLAAGCMLDGLMVIVPAVEARGNGADDDCDGTVDEENL